MVKSVGIDIGSQKTIIVADDGEIVRTSTGSVSSPTLIAFHGKAPRSIGDEATSGETIVPMINQLIGKTYDEIQGNESLKGVKVSVQPPSTDSVPSINVTYGENNIDITSTSLLGLYLCKIYERISQVYGEVDLAISCPPNAPKSVIKAYFDASSIAGIDINRVHVVDATDAIVAAYSRKLHAIKGPERSNLDNKLVALIEVGHVQSTVVIVKVNPVVMNSKDVSLGTTKIAVAHDDSLGSLFFDYKLFDHFSKVCLSKYQTKVDYGTRRGNRLLSGCERMRKLLSQLNEGVTTIENLTDNGDVSFSLRRDEFMEICRDLLDRIKLLIHKAADEAISVISSQVSVDSGEIASDENKKVSFVETFGGGLRMPAIQTLLTEIFGSDITLGAKLDDGSLAIGSALVINRKAIALEAAIAAATSTAMDSLSSPSSLLPDLASTAVVYKAEDFTDERGLSPEEILSAREKELSMQSRDEEVRQLLSARNSLESYILEMRSAPKRKFGELIDSQKLNSILDDSEGWIWDNQDASLSDLREKNDSLRSSVNEVCKGFFDAVNTAKLEVERKLDEEAEKAKAEKNDEDEEDHDNRKLKKADRMRLVVKNKDEGTELFKGGNYRPAAARYHKALTHIAKFFDLSPDDEAEVKALKISLHLNLASCYLKMDKLDQALTNSEDAIALDTKNPKAYFRRSQYYEAKKDWEKALDDARKCQTLMDTDDKLVRQTVERLNKEVNKQKEKEKKMWSKAFS